MTQEQKAKAYDEAMKVAVVAHKDKDRHLKATLESIFPELKESGDEKIRRVIRGWIYTRPASFFDNGISKEEVLAWLEKQCEKHLENYDEAEKEKADFVGDGFIECHADYLDFKEGNTYWLEYIGDDKYNVRSDNLLGKTYHITPCQLYTIFKKQTWLEKQCEQKPLFKKGDTVIWDGEEFDILDVTKDSYNVGGYIIPIYRQNELLLKQKPAWGEEDKYNHHIILALLNNECVGCADKRIAIDWFNSLKDRYTWKPSDEQITWLYRAADDASKDSRMKQILNELLSDLKKLREE